MKKRVAFVHFRTGERDGVGLELARRASLIQELGGKVFYITGHDNLERKEAYIIPELDVESNLNKFLQENFFEQKIFDESLVVSLYSQLEHKIYKKMDKVIAEIKPHLIFIHNFFSLAFNLPAATAFVRLLDKYQIPVVALHHDFWFEEIRGLKPRFGFIKEILTTLPPKGPYILKHQVINSLSQAALWERRKIKAEKIGDYFDFSRTQLKRIDDFNRDFEKSFGIGKNDLVVLQATRIVRRKAVENTLYFVRFLEDELRKRAPVKINGRIFKKENHVFFLSSNFPEIHSLDYSLDYYRSLKTMAEKLGIKALWEGNKFAANRKKENGAKIYSFWDAYVFADLVSYPSIWEGFGNQFLETLFFKKLPIVFEYPVFEEDIKPEGYEYVSLGNKINKKGDFHFVPRERIERTAKETAQMLSDQKRLERMVNRNFKIAKKHHDISILRRDLKKILAKINP